jgi:glycerol-3-phosphate dehydrogenase
VLVNAAGPWVADFIKTGLKRTPGKGIRLIKGSHIIVPKFHNYPGAFILQNEDNRIVFTLPYMDKFHLIGTTDKEYKGDPAKVSIDEDEKSYLLSVVNAHFCHQLKKEDIVGSFSGVRPLCDDESSDPSAVTRDYTIELESDAQHPPLLSVYGGKLTTYRKLANAALEKLKPIFPTMKGEWTQHESLPGATSAISDYKQIEEIIANIYPWLDTAQLQRFSKAYGLNTLKFLNGAKTPEDLGYHFGEGLYQREVDYLTKHEWAVTAEDILWRRTKLGLSLTKQEQLALVEYLAPPSDSLKRA